MRSGEHQAGAEARSVGSLAEQAANMTGRHRQWADGERGGPLPRLVSILMGIVLIGQVTTIGLSSFQRSAAALPAVADPGGRIAAKLPVNVDAIVSSHLFGVAALDTRSDSDLPAAGQLLQLSATFAMRDPGQGYAILGQSDQAAQVFAVGARIVDGSVLQRVYKDRVILNRDGKLERLTLLGRAGAVISQTSAPQSERQGRASAPELIAAENSSSNVPVRMEKFLLLPVFGARDSGARIGMPRNPAEFSKTGLSAGDILTAVDGTPVHGAQSAADLLRAAAGHALTLTVQRGAETQEIQVDSID
jgi:general secretion pathway protein C